MPGEAHVYFRAFSVSSGRKVLVMFRVKSAGHVLYYRVYIDS